VWNGEGRNNVGRAKPYETEREAKREGAERSIRQKAKSMQSKTPKYMYICMCSCMCEGRWRLRRVVEGESARAERESSNECGQQSGNEHKAERPIHKTQTFK